MSRGTCLEHLSSWVSTPEAFLLLLWLVLLMCDLTGTLLPKPWAAHGQPPHLVHPLHLSPVWA